MVTEISVEELKNLLQKEQIQLIDVRSPVNFLIGHIEQAKSIPLSMLPEKISELDKSKLVYAICNKGVSSLEVAHFLEQEGFQAISIKGGMTAWKELPMPH